MPHRDSFVVCGSLTFRAGLCALALGLLLPAAADATARLRSTHGHTMIQLNEGLLGDLGFRVVATLGAARGAHSHGAEVVTALHTHPDQSLAFPIAEGSELELYAPGGRFRELAGGVLRHDGGLVLSDGTRTIDLTGFSLHPSRKADALFDLRSATDEVLFHLLRPHYELNLERGEARFFNMDLVLTAALARKLGLERFAGSTFGMLNVTLDLEAPPDFQALGEDCVMEFDEPDVRLTNLTGLSHFGRKDGRVAVAPSASLDNIGEDSAHWDAAMLPTHPFLLLDVYRLSADNVLEQIAVGDVKHAFFTVNSGCACAGGAILSPGCGDTYGVFNNTDPDWLAPRDELHAFTGTWDPVGSHFDGLPADGVRSHSQSDHSSTFDHGLLVPEADLDNPGARYFATAWYIVQNDIDIYNSMGSYEFDPEFDGAWSFSPVTGMTRGPVVDRWVDPSDPPAGSRNTRIETGEGHLVLAVQTEAIDETGSYRYRYSLMNLDYDPTIVSLSLPIGDASVNNLSFGDIDDDPENDWVFDLENGVLTISTVNDGLPYDALYHFGFDATGAPTNRTATLGPAGGRGLIGAATLGPGSGVTLATPRGETTLAVFAGLLLLLGPAFVRRRVPVRPDARSGPDRRSGPTAGDLRERL